MQQFNLNIILDSIKFRFSQLKLDLSDQSDGRDISFLKPNNTFRNLIFSVIFLLSLVISLILFSYIVNKHRQSQISSLVHLNGSYPAYTYAGHASINLGKTPGKGKEGEDDETSTLNPDKDCPGEGLNEIDIFALILGIPESGTIQIANMLKRTTNAHIARQQGLLARMLRMDLRERQEVSDLFCDLWGHVEKNKTSTQHFSVKKNRSRRNAKRTMSHIGVIENGFHGIQLVSHASGRFMKKIIEPFAGWGVKVRGVMVVRNPSDVIRIQASHHFVKDKAAHNVGRKKVYTEGQIIHEEFKRHSFIDKLIDQLEQEAQSCSDLINNHKMDLLVINYENMEQDTTNAVKQLFRFLGVKYTKKQLSSAAADLKHQLRMFDRANMEEIKLNSLHKSRLIHIVDENRAIYSKYVK